jgi:hypothetical protein
MPLELGMAAAFRFEREGSRRPHRWLALVPDGYAYKTYISDLAGFDPRDTTHRCHPLSAKCLPGSVRNRRRHSISKTGPMLYQRPIELFRCVK